MGPLTSDSPSKARLAQVLIVEDNPGDVFLLEVLQGIRASNSVSAIPVVVVTRSKTESDREMARQLGASEYIVKPASLAEYLTIGLRLKEYPENSR